MDKKVWAMAEKSYFPTQFRQWKSEFSRKSVPRVLAFFSEGVRIFWVSLSPARSWTAWKHVGRPSERSFSHPNRSLNAIIFAVWKSRLSKWLQNRSWLSVGIPLLESPRISHFEKYFFRFWTHVFLCKDLSVILNCRQSRVQVLFSFDGPNIRIDLRRPHAVHGWF